MKKVALATLVIAFIVGAIILNHSYQTGLEAEAKIAADAKRIVDEADQQKADEERMAHEATLLAASDSQLGTIAKQCAEMIQTDVSGMNSYGWSFTGLKPSDYDSLKYLAFRKMPMSTYGIEASMDLPIEMNVLDARSLIAIGFAPMTMRFVILRTDDSFSGLTRSLRLYTCQLDGLSAQSVYQSDNIVIPE